MSVHITDGMARAAGDAYLEHDWWVLDIHDVGYQWSCMCSAVGEICGSEEAAECGGDMHAWRAAVAAALAVGGEQP